MTPAARTFAAVCLLVALAAPLVQAQAPGTLIRYDNWMGQLFDQRPAALDEPLARFIFPGSHDAGAYALTGDLACNDCSIEQIQNIARNCPVLPETLGDICDGLIVPNLIAFTRDWGNAQHLTIRGQLDAGARYMDLRFFRATSFDQARSLGRLQAGRFYVHHALAGPDSATVLSDIAAFMTAPGHEREVVILEFSSMKEGNGDMSAATRAAFFDEVRATLGSYMAPTRNEACAGDASCPATARFGGAATIGELLNQGHRLIVACDCGTDFSAPDVWTRIASASVYSISGGGYPDPDDEDNPWIGDHQIFRLLERASSERDDEAKDELFTMGVQVGLDDNVTAVVRSVVCPIDVGNVSGLCDAVNNDWDELASLNEAASYTNPKALPALVGLRRDRLNIVHGDHFSTMFTEEAFKLNRGATRVQVSIDTVAETSSHDTGSAADFYPVFLYPASTPILWQVMPQRHLQAPNASFLAPGWPGWKAYPNDLEAASVGFAIRDADSGAAGDDDTSNISFFPDPATSKSVTVPISDCVQDATACLNLFAVRQTQGFGVRSAAVNYRVGSCLWSWLAGDTIDPAGACARGTRQLNVRHARRVEGHDGSVSFTFDVTLSAPSPAPVTVHYRTQDDTATAGTDYTQVPDTVLTFAPGDTRQTVTVLVNGDRTLEGHEWFRLNLSSASGAEILNSIAVGFIANDDFPTVSIGDEVRSEFNGGDTVFTFPVTLDGPSTGPVSVYFATSDGTATAGSDYTPNSGTLTFAPGETSKAVTVHVDGDRTIELDETFFVTLSSPTNATIVRGIAAGTIVNDDLPRISVSSVTKAEGTGGITAFDFDVMLDTASLVPVTLRYVTLAQTATAGTDFTMLPETLTMFAPGEASKTITVQVIGDAALETDETFTFHIFAVTGALVITGTGTGTIQNDDAALSLTAPAAQSGAEGAGVAFSLGTLNDARPGPWTISVNWGDTHQDSFAVTTAGAIARNHAYADNGSYTVTVSAVDAAHVVSNTVTFTATIANVNPTGTLASLRAVPEGRAATVSFGGVTDPSTPDGIAGLRYAFSCANSPLDGVTYASASAAIATSCTYPDNGSYTVRGRVFDKDGGFTEYTTGVTVFNALPVMDSLKLKNEAGGSIGSNSTSNIYALYGLPIELMAGFADTGTLDTHQATITWGDGSSESGSIEQSGGASHVHARHTWQAPGQYTVRLAIRDDDGGQDAREVIVRVTHGPDAACQSPSPVMPLLDDASLSADTRRDIRRVLGRLWGRIDGPAANGACDMFIAGEEHWLDALDALGQATERIEASIAGGGLNVSQAAALRDMEAQLVLSVQWFYVQLAGATLDAAKLADAAAVAELAADAMAAHSHAAATALWIQAVRALL